MKALPPTPVTGAVTSDTAVMPLEPVQADGSDILRKMAESSNLKLNDSIHATKNYKAKWAPAGKRASAAMPIRRAPMMSFSSPFATIDEEKRVDRRETRRHKKSPSPTIRKR